MNAIINVLESIFVFLCVSPYYVANVVMWAINNPLLTLICSLVGITIIAIMACIIAKLKRA